MKSHSYSNVPSFALFGTKAGLEPCPITFIKSLALFLSATALFLPWEYLSFFLVSYL